MLERDSAMWQAIESILRNIVESVEPQQSEGLLDAAVPQWFSTDLFAALVTDDTVSDGADQLLDWVTQFSFISTLSRERTDFMMQPMERAILNEIFIDQAPDRYREAHFRALDYWLNHPYRDPAVQAQNVLYHRIIVDQEAARQELIDLFEHYADDRQLGAMEKLLKAASESCGYLSKLGRPSRSLNELIYYMHARHAQLQGRWQESEEMLAQVHVEAEPGLQPFVTRANGYARAGTRDYAAAIDQFQLAAEQFVEHDEILGVERSRVERADTLIALGDAYIDLAEATISLDERRRRMDTKWRRLQGVYYLLLSLPLAVYLTRAIGFRAWLPSLWSMWRDVDWIKADLYSEATRHYEEAGRLLDEVNRPDRNLIADEKLADLYLSVGDAPEASTLYERLLASTELSDYRRSRIQVGYGQTRWLLGDEEAAEQALTGALPSLRYYADLNLEAEAETVLGSIAAESSDPEDALPHFHRALDIYLIEESADLAAATGVAEQLDLVAEHPALTTQAREAAREEAARVEERHYPVQQRYRVTRFFQQMFLFSVIVLGGIGLLNLISIDRTTVAPKIVFHASPLLDADKGVPVAMLDTTTYAISDKSEIIVGEGLSAQLQIGQGIKSLVIENPEMHFVVVGLLISFIGYMIAVTAIGVWWLWRIDPQAVQDTRESSTVRLREEALSMGEEEAQRSVPFADVARYVVSNTRLFRRPVSDSYLLLEKPSGEQFVVKGATAHYDRVQQHIEERLPPTAERADLSHSLLLSLAGVLLLFTVLLYLIIVIFSRVRAESVYAPLAGSPYSGVTLFPYLLLGFLLPALWWFVWKPLQRSRRLDVFDWKPFILIIAGLLIILSITVVTGLGYRFRLSTPDLYPALVAVGLILAGVVALTVTAVKDWRSDADQPPVEPLDEGDLQGDTAVDPAMSFLKRMEIRVQTLPGSVRTILFILLYVLLLVVSALTIVYLSREINAYHFWVQGENILKEGNQQKDSGQAGWQELIAEAHEDYSEAIRIAEEGAWRVFDDETLADIYTSRAHASLILGIEELAQTNESNGADPAVRDHYEAAVADYEKAIELAPESPEAYLWLGFAQHTAGDVQDARENYSRAILYGGITGEEIASVGAGASCPQREDGGIYLKPDYIVKALTGLGWIYFAEQDYQQAFVNFWLASAYADCLGPEFVQEKSEAALGLGYTYYKDRLFDEAEEVWLEASQRDPQNAALLTSLGTVYWRLGTLGQDYTESGSDRCNKDELDDAEKARAAALLEQSIEYLTRSAEVARQLPEDRAYTYRTRGQVQYLLRHCPGYDKYQVYQDAIDSYSLAIESYEEEPYYHFMRSRLGYVQWLESPLTGPDAREPVVRALTDITETLRLTDRTCPETVQPFDYNDPCSWYPVIRGQAVDGVLSTADAVFDQGDFKNAERYYSLLTRHVPFIEEIYLAQLGLGRTAFAQGNVALALDWYERGIAGADAADDRGAIIKEWDRLLTLQESDPSVDPQSLQELFDTVDYDYDVAGSFNRGLAAMRTGDIETSRDAYESGIRAVMELGDFDIIKQELLAILNEPPGDGRAAVLEPFGEWMPRFEQAAADDQAVKEAFDLGFIAWVLGDSETAGEWYQEGIRRSTLISTAYSQALKPSRDDLAALWGQGAEVDGDNLIEAMNAYRPQQLEEHPDLLEDPLYWRYLGWFKYHVALKAFLAGDLDVAETVLESGKQDAEVAFPLDESGNRYVLEYLDQGAWSWYFIERAMLRQRAEDLEGAYADYVAALSSYPKEVTDNTARSELVDSAFEAGLLAFGQGLNDQALHWYKLGVERAEEYGEEDRIEAARSALQNEPVEGVAAELQQELLELLGSEQQ